MPVNLHEDSQNLITSIINNALRLLIQAPAHGAYYNMSCPESYVYKVHSLADQLWPLVPQSCLAEEPHRQPDRSRVRRLPNQYYLRLW